MTAPASASRILRLITRLNIGGPARQALLLTRDLAEQYPTVLAAGTPTAVEGELVDADVPVRRVPLVRPLRPSVDARAVVAVRRLITEIRPALVHTHMAKAGTVGRLSALTCSTRPVTVHSFHGHVLDGYFRAPVQRGFIEIERSLARRTDVLIAISPEIRDALLDLGIGRLQQYRVIPLGLDLSSFLAIQAPTGRLRSALGLGNDVALVGAIGRLVAIKDLETLFAALQHLGAVHLAVIGDGELRPYLEGRARAMGIADRVHFTGWWPDVPGAVSDLDVVALTSRNEGTPVSLIEAAAAGCPVVATRVGGVARTVEDGVTGYLARPGDSRQIADQISHLLAHSEIRRRMGQAGRRLARERFGHQRLLTDIAALYSELAPRTTASTSPARH